MAGVTGLKKHSGLNLELCIFLSRFTADEFLGVDIDVTFPN
jgi:hypothetical protein